MTGITDAMVRPRGGSFFMWMAAASAVIAFGGFASTYWLQVPAGTFVGSPLLHLHALLFSAWPLFLIFQTWQVGAGRIAQHRVWGVAGVSLATALVFTGVAAAIGSLTSGLAAGYGDASRTLFAAPMSAIFLFVGFFAAAMLNVRRPETHKRLMLLATFALLPAAIARVLFTIATGGGPGLRPGIGAPPPPLLPLVASLIGLALVLVCIFYDWRKRGRPYPAWLIGFGVILAVALIRLPFSQSPVWYAFADYMAGFAN